MKVPIRPNRGRMRSRVNERPNISDIFYTLCPKDNQKVYPVWSMDILKQRFIFSFNGPISNTAYITKK